MMFVVVSLAPGVADDASGLDAVWEFAAPIRNAISENVRAARRFPLGSPASVKLRAF